MTFNTQEEYLNINASQLQELVNNFYLEQSKLIYEACELQFFQTDTSGVPGTIDSWSEYMVEAAKQGKYSINLSFLIPETILLSEEDVIDIISLWWHEDADRKTFYIKYLKKDEDNNSLNFLISWDPIHNIDNETGIDQFETEEAFLAAVTPENLKELALSFENRLSIPIRQACEEQYYKGEGDKNLPGFIDSWSEMMYQAAYDGSESCTLLFKYTEEISHMNKNFILQTLQRWWAEEPRSNFQFSTRNVGPNDIMFSISWGHIAIKEEDNNNN